MGRGGLSSMFPISTHHHPKKGQFLADFTRSQKSPLFPSYETTVSPSEKYANVLLLLLSPNGFRRANTVWDGEGRGPFLPLLLLQREPNKKEEEEREENSLKKGGDRC